MAMKKEPTLLDYARYYGLAVPVDKVDPLSDFLASNPPHLDLSDPPGCPGTSVLTSPLLETLLHEKIVVSRNVAQHLARSLKPPEHISWAGLNEYRHLKDLRAELPLLPTDHEVDVMQFIAEAKRPTPNLRDLKFIPVDEENDEGLAFPRRYLEAADNIHKQIAKEKLDTTREVLSTTRRLLDRRPNPETEKQMVKDDLRYHRSMACEPLTPLMLPLHEGKEPFVPSSPALRLDLLSDKSDPMLPSQRQMDKDIFRADQITIDDCDSANAEKVKHLLEIAQRAPKPSESKLFLIEETDRSTSRPPKEDFKLEPLLPPVAEFSSPETHREDTLAHYFKETALSSNVEDLKVNKLENLLDNEELGQKARLALEKLNTSVRHEQIDRVEAIGRVSIPSLDNSFGTKPPWERGATLACSDHITELISDAKSKRQSDHDFESKLNWIPFSGRWPNIQVHETITGSEELVCQFLRPPKDVVKSKDLLWKPEKLKVLQDGDENDEDDLEEDINLASELGNVKFNASKLPQQHNTSTGEVGLKKVAKAKPLKRPVPRPADCSNAVSFEARDSIQSISASPLAAFLQTRGRKVRKLVADSSAHFPQRDPEEGEKQPQPPVQTDSQVPATPVQINSTAAASTVVTYPSPPKASLTTTRSLIIDTALLNTYSSLVHRLETHSPHPPQLVFREFLSGSQSPSADEPAPDIILSPRSALIIIPLQSVIQRALPGRGPATPVQQSRIIHLASQFDKLFVLTTCKISEGRIDTTTASSLATLTALSASLGLVSEVSIILIPPMTNQESHALALLRGEKLAPNHHLLNWILALIEQHGFPSKGLDFLKSLVFLTEATAWETFLRRAGLNPSAAQVVLGMLKRPAQTHSGAERQRGEQPELWGIRKLVQMSQEEREHFFEAVVGKRAIERLGQMLDFVWQDFGRNISSDEGLAMDLVDWNVAAGSMDMP